MEACSPCPEYSFAYFPGSTACIACYFGEPKVVAGKDDGFWPYNLPAEQARAGGWQCIAAELLWLAWGELASYPALYLASRTCCAAGYRSAVLTDNLGSCPFAHPFKTDCSATAGRTVAFETDASCLVRVYVLGDPSCSQTDNMTIVDG